MAKVYDVPADVLISRLAEVLKNEDIPAPTWASFVKTGAHADKPPQNRDWWHTRCASIMRKIYLKGPVGTNELRNVYGGGKPSGYGMAHH
ncbi:MAG: 40S ribosomal protein S19, partial [Nitrosopumilus sp.]|nr:40S ribosomal protein S19 [Nitrosopumilus sp.]